MPRDPQPDWLTDLRRTIGDRIRAHREWRNRTQWWVCEATGINRTTYQDIERGETDARLTWLARIAAALDVPLTQLIDTEAPPPQ